jgi:hypothetical protein
VGHPVTHFIQDVFKIGSESQRVHAAGDSVRKPAHPTGKETVPARQAFLGPEIPAAGVVIARTQLSIGHRREQRDQPVQGKGHNQRRPGYSSRDAGQDKNSRPDHGAHADQRGV